MRNKIVLGLFILSQVLDGLLTYYGLQRGVPEGNFFIEFVMASTGVLPALILAKGISILFGFFLYKLSGDMLLLLTIMWWVAVVPRTLNCLGLL